MSVAPFSALDYARDRFPPNGTSKVAISCVRLTVHSSRPECAQSGQFATAWRTVQIDPNSRGPSDGQPELQRWGPALSTQNVPVSLLQLVRCSAALLAW